MKKILLSTAIVAASAGFAAAEVTVGGSAGMWIANNGTDTTFNHSIDVSFGMMGTTDGGLEFGASVTLQEDGTTDGPGSVYISGAFGKLAFGDVDSADAAVGVGMPDIGYDGLGVDNVAEQRRGDSGSEALYTNTFGGVSVALSLDDPSSSDDFAIGAAYKTDAFSFAIGYADDGGDKIVNAKVGASVSGVAATLYVEDSDSIGQGAGLHLAYTSGPLTVGAAYATHQLC